jgi:predicted LPLAT superfamily acyltransferase
VTPTSLPRDDDAAWASTAERGSPLALRFVLWFFRRFGAPVTRLLLHPIVAYYCVFAGQARRASRAYLERVRRVRGEEGPSPGLRDTYRHLYTFAESILDKFSFWAGGAGDFDIAIRGGENMEKYFGPGGGGAFLVGAHFGNFDVLRVIARDAGIRVNVLLFTANARRVNAALETLDPGSNVRIIDIDPTSVQAAFEIRRCAGRGELVAVLADRVQFGGRHRVGYATFLGERAAFPEGPFLIPLILGLPLVLTLALKTGPKSYELIIESLGEAEAVPARDRPKVLAERIESFASRLEHHCLRAPYQWFNFYDFWSESHVGRR